MTKQSASILGKDLGLTPKEFEVISFLAQNRGQTFSKEQLYEHIWGYDEMGEARTIAEHIKNIRKKMLNIGENKEYIITVWGIGYRWH